MRFHKPLLAILGLLLSAAASHAQDAPQPDAFKPPPPVTYTERFEAYGGISFMNGQAGQTLPKRYNLAGGEGMFTWWITPRFGAIGDYRWEAGTTPVLPKAQSAPIPIQTRPLVTQNIYMGGVNYRWKHNQHAALSFHGLVGGTSGNFTHSTNGQDPTYWAGMYENHTAPMGVLGASLDFNRSARWAIRVSPELVFEHFGDETREFFYISGGVVYRFGKR